MERQDKDLAFMLIYENVAWYKNGLVRILDRRIYPQEIVFVECKSHQEVTKAIADMVTQSAGPYTAVAMGMALAANECQAMSNEAQIIYLKEASATLSNARPTTASRMEIITNKCVNIAIEAIHLNRPVDTAIFEHAISSLNRRYEIMSKVATYLVEMMPQNATILTQCFGETIVGTMLREAKRVGKTVKVYCAETRPFFQGARFTATVASDMGFDTTVITDNMVAYTMKHCGIDIFTSAADAITLDGHVVNKIGTHQIAILAKHLGIPYFVTGIPDRTLPTIEHVSIEYRNSDEVTHFKGHAITAKKVKAIYPSFDITPPYLVSGIVTDNGIYSPYDLATYVRKTEDNFWN